jgi:hypothetical protein
MKSNDFHISRNRDANILLIECIRNHLMGKYGEECFNLAPPVTNIAYMRDAELYFYLFVNIQPNMTEVRRIYVEQKFERMRKYLYKACRDYAKLTNRSDVFNKNKRDIKSMCNNFNVILAMTGKSNRDISNEALLRDLEDMDARLDRIYNS